MGYVSLYVNHRLEHPGAREPWTCAHLEETLNSGFAQRYTDSVSHLQPEFKAIVEAAKLRISGLSPPGLIGETADAIQWEAKHGHCFNLFTIHNEAWLFLEQLQEATTAVLGNNPVLNSGNKAQMLPFVSGICFAAAAGKTLDHSRKMPSSDALFQVAAAVLEVFVRDGHGRAIKDVATKFINPEDVKGPRQGLVLCGLDDMKFDDDSWGPSLPGGNKAMAELEKLLRILKSSTE